MDINELRSRAADRDATAYLELSNEYGWKLYSYLRDRIDDQKGLSSAYEKILRGFYQGITDDNRQGSIETMLYEAADRFCADNGSQPASKKARKQKSTHKQEQSRKEKGSGFGFWLSFLVLLVLNLICLWIIAGLFMDMGLIPFLDLGYDWFNNFISAWF